MGLTVPIKSLLSFGTQGAVTLHSATHSLQDAFWALLLLCPAQVEIPVINLWLFTKKSYFPFPWISAAGLLGPYLIISSVLHNCTYQEFVVIRHSKWSNIAFSDSFTARCVLSSALIVSYRCRSSSNTFLNISPKSHPLCFLEYPPQFYLVCTSLYPPWA